MTHIDPHVDTPWLTSLLRGFKRRCPRCGQGKLFKGYLKVCETCEVCKLNFTQVHNADDGPAYFTMSFILFILVPTLLWLDIRYELYLEILFLVFLPSTILVTMGLLPLVKGAFVAASWKAKPENNDL